MIEGKTRDSASIAITQLKRVLGRDCDGASLAESISSGLFCRFQQPADFDAPTLKRRFSCQICREMSEQSQSDYNRDQNGILAGFTIVW